MQKKYLTSELVRRENRLSFFNYIGILPNPDEILNKTGNSIENYRKLKYDPHVWSCIQSRKSGLQNLEYSLLIDDVDPALSKLIEQFISEIYLSDRKSVV